MRQMLRVSLGSNQKVIGVHPQRKWSINHHFQPVKGSKWKSLSFIISVILLLSLVTITQASGFSLTRSTADNGGGILSEDEFVLTTNIGQPEADGIGLSKGGYQLVSGALVGIGLAEGPTQEAVYLPVVINY